MKEGGELIKMGGANNNFEILNLGLPEYFEVGLLLEEATQLAWASWATTSSPFFL